MTMTAHNTGKEKDAFKLLAEFKKLRQNGVNRDEAWYLVTDAAGELDQTTYNAFLKLAKDWERKVGYQYHYRDPESAEATIARRELADRIQASGADVARLPDPPKPSANGAGSAQPAGQPPKSTMTGRLDPSKLREYEQRNLENVLDQIDDLYQSDPAFQSQKPPASPPPPVAQPPARPPAPAQPAQVSAQAAAQDSHQTGLIRPPEDFFGPNTGLLMWFKSHAQPLRVMLRDGQELYIGRATPNSAMAPDIDLNPVGGAEFGVSRMHAAITRRDNHLLIADLNSRNFTYVNGVRLQPNEVRILRENDEIWFGQLACRIRFHHQQ